MILPKVKVEKRYLYEHSSEYKRLTDKYQDSFKTFVLKKTFHPSKEFIFTGANEISEYLAKGMFFFLFKESYEAKSGREKVSTAIFFRISKFLKMRGEEYYRMIEEDIENMARDAVFYALGMDIYKNRRSFLWNPKKVQNFIRFVNSAVLKELFFIYMKTKEVEYFSSMDAEEEAYGDLQTMEDVVINEMSDSEMRTGNISKSKIYATLSPSIQKKIKNEIAKFGSIKNAIIHSKELSPYLRAIQKDLLCSNG